MKLERQKSKTSGKMFSLTDELMTELSRQNSGVSVGTLTLDEKQPWDRIADAVKTSKSSELEDKLAELERKRIELTEKHCRKLSVSKNMFSLNNELVTEMSRQNSLRSIVSVDTVTSKSSELEGMLAELERKRIALAQHHLSELEKHTRRLSENMKLSRQNSNVSTATLPSPKAAAAASPKPKVGAPVSISKTGAAAFGVSLSTSVTPQSKVSESPKTVQPPAKKVPKKMTKHDKLVASLEKTTKTLEAKKETLQHKLEAAHAKNASGAAVTRLNKQIQALNKKIAQTNLKKYNARQKAKSG